MQPNMLSGVPRSLLEKTLLSTRNLDLSILLRATAHERVCQLLIEEDVAAVVSVLKQKSQQIALLTISVLETRCEKIFQKISQHYPDIIFLRQNYVCETLKENESLFLPRELLLLEINNENNVISEKRYYISDVCVLRLHMYKNKDDDNSFYAELELVAIMQ